MKSRRTREMAALALTVLALSAAMSFQHWVIHRQVILPALQNGGVVPLWMWAAMFVPEIIVCFLTGLRLRGTGQLVTYAFTAAAHRQIWSYALARSGDPGHIGSNGLEFALSTPLIGFVYLAFFALASLSAREEGPQPTTE